MSEEQKARVVAIAAALIGARGKGSVQDAMEALVDAEHILHPKPADPKYKAWQTAQGMTPSTEAEDEQRRKVAAERRERSLHKLTGGF